MSTATAKAVTPQDILAIGEDLTNNVLVERNAEMRTLILGALAGKNIHQLGPAGTGKSKMLRAFAGRIVGARFFAKLVHAQMPADAVLGGYDMPRFASTGEFARNSEHYLPNAHIGFIDEVTRANGPTLDALLPILNTEERMAESNGGMSRTPLLFVVTASNYMPDPDDPHLAAFVDRITLMQYIDYVRADDSFKTMATQRHARRSLAATEAQDDLTNEGFSQDSPVPGDTTLSLDQFIEAQRQALTITPGAEFLDRLAQLRRAAKDEGLMVSDRRWMESVDLCGANAWLNSREEMTPEDIVCLEPTLWRERDQIPVAHSLILPFHGRFEREAAQYQQEMAAPLASLEETRPTVESTPPTEQIPEEMMRKALVAARALAQIKHRNGKLLAEAKKEKHNAGELQDIDNEISAAFKWLEEYSMPVPKT